MKHLSKILLITLLSWHSIDLGAQVMANTLDPVPANWTGKVFQLSKSYPTGLPAATEPWKAFNFKTQPLQYINAVKNYVLAGNVAKDWVLQNNTVRKWYHAPSMVWGNNGREFINGLTRERSSQPFELHPSQSHTCQNWAVGFYNPRGGYTLGRVYKIPEKPDVTKAIFPEGTVAAKLLFTNASLNEVPYLSNAFSWQANIHTTQSGTNRSPATVRLLQMDIAVKDSRAGSTTDWVMITFAYNDNAPGSTPWEKLVPVGLEWGNDPASIATNAPLTETWINPAFTALFTIGNWTMHKGYLGRLNGPVDNPKSSCISCHGTAQYPKVSTGMIPGNTPASIASYFRNINPPALFENKPNITERTLDYSLQLSVGIPLAFAAGAPVPVAHSTTPGDTSQTAAIREMLLTTRDFEQEDQVTEPPQENEPKTVEPIAVVNPPKEEGNKYLGWMIGGGLLILVVGGYFLFRKK